MQLEDLGRQFEEALLSLDRLRAERILMASRGAWTPVELVERLVRPVLEHVGVGWQEGVVALSQLYMSGRICEELVDSVLPPAGPGRNHGSGLAIAALEDHHRLGKRIVYSVLRASGFELLDYGHGVGVEDLARRTMEDGLTVLLVSTLMLRSALRVADLRAELDRLGSGAKIVVGGAPFLFDDQLWKEVGADAMGRTASDAVGILSRMTGAV